MRSARNFHPGWGYVAPAPSLIRTVRVVLVATAVGAAAGASVVFSLVDRLAAETSDAARTLAGPVRAASAPLSTPQAAQMSAQAAIQNQSTKPSVANGHEELIAASESSTSSTAPPPAGIAALTEVLAPTNAVPASAADVKMPTAGGAPAADPAPLQKKATKKPHFVSRYASRGGLPLLLGEYYNRTYVDRRRGYY